MVSRHLTDCGKHIFLNPKSPKLALDTQDTLVLKLMISQKCSVLGGNYNSIVYQTVRQGTILATLSEIEEMSIKRYDVNVK